MLHFVGDINFTDGFFDTGFGIGSLIKKGFNPFEKFHFNAFDKYVGNFECVCSNDSNKEGVYRKQFIIEPDFLKCLTHFNIYSVANNHIMQHGEMAFVNTLKNIEAFGSLHVGSLISKSISFTHNHYSVGLLSFSYRPEKYSAEPKYWNSPDLAEIKHEFLNISSNDLKIAIIHWGNEFINMPYSEQKIIGRGLIDMGFDLIVGIHPHVLQGYEKYKNGYIFYSLGNFLFNMASDQTHYSAILHIDMDKEKRLISKTEYIKLDKNGFPEIIEECDVPNEYKFSHLNGLLKENVENERYYSIVAENTKKYRKANFALFLRSLPKFSLLDLRAILIDFYLRRIR